MGNEKIEMRNEKFRYALLCNALTVQGPGRLPMSKRATEQTSNRIIKKQLAQKTYPFQSSQRSALNAQCLKSNNPASGRMEAA
jgi:hypothetical protein